MSETTRQIENIFPKILFIRKEKDASWTTPEFIKQCLGLEYRKNGDHNWATTNAYVLDLPDFKELKDAIQDELDKIIEEYYQKNIKETQLYITQSWINVNDDGDSHPPHCHPNSILSGVVYIDVAENDCIDFVDQRHDTRVALEGTPTYTQPVEQGDIVMFDSQIHHHVVASNRDKKRISLAFNTFVKGTLGSKEGLTEVKINGYTT